MITCLIDAGCVVFQMIILLWQRAFTTRSFTTCIEPEEVLQGFRQTGILLTEDDYRVECMRELHRIVADPLLDGDSVSKRPTHSFIYLFFVFIFILRAHTVGCLPEENLFGESQLRPWNVYP